MKKPLCTAECGQNLTDRECCKILGGLIGGLATVANLDDVRNAVRWWADTDEAWEQMKNAQELSQRLMHPKGES